MRNDIDQRVWDAPRGCLPEAKIGTLVMFIVVALIWPVSYAAAERAQTQARDRADDIVRPRAHMPGNGEAAIDLRNGPFDAPTSMVLADPDGMGRIEIESASVTFGSTAAGEEKELPSALTLRVFSPRPWSLRLLPAAQLMNLDEGSSVDWSRVQWKGRAARYLPLAPEGAVIARGNATAVGGELVTIDLRFGFGSSDPLGHYISSLRVALDVF